MSYILHFELFKLPPSLNQMLRGHWRSRSAIQKSFKLLTMAEIARCHHERPERPLEKYRITFTRHTIKPLDVDNLAASFKAVLDALTASKIILDDKWGMTEAVFYRQVKVSKKALQKIDVLVEEL